MKNGTFIGFFIADQQSPFYQSDAFTQVLQFVQANAYRVTMKEKKGAKGLRLLLRFGEATSIDEVFSVLRPLLPKLPAVVEE